MALEQASTIRKDVKLYREIKGIESVALHDERMKFF